MLGNKTVIICALLFVFSGSIALAQTPAPPMPAGPITPIGGGGAPVSIEFISPMFTEFIPNAPGSPMGDCWEVVIEASINQARVWPRIGVFESFNQFPPGLMNPIPTDVNGDGIMGDPNPFFPDLIVTCDEPWIVLGMAVPPGINLASLFHKAGSEKELDGTQTTTFAMTVDPMIATITDTNGDNMAILKSTIRNATDWVQFQLGMFTGNYGPGLTPETPTISFFTPDWISTVSADELTEWALGIEVRIPCFSDGVNAWAFDPLPGPFMPVIGAMTQIQTGFSVFPGMPGMPNPNFPTLAVVFSDDFMDVNSGNMFLGGTISGCMGGNPATLRVTGQNLATLIQEVGVTWWFGVNGVPDAPQSLTSDDELIYRFVMIVRGHIQDTDVLPNEMIATAGIVTTGGLSSISNVRIKHDHGVFTPDPQ